MLESITGRHTHTHTQHVCDTLQVKCPLAVSGTKKHVQFHLKQMNANLVTFYYDGCYMCHSSLEIKCHF